jgi:hypothetical protein
LLRDGQRADIIQFYNRIYIPIMESPLLELHRSALARPAESAKLDQTLALNKRVNQLGSLGGNKLLLSPMSPQRAVEMAPLNNVDVTTRVLIVSAAYLSRSLPLGSTVVAFGIVVVASRRRDVVDRRACQRSARCTCTAPDQRNNQFA